MNNNILIVKKCSKQLNLYNKVVTSKHSMFNDCDPSTQAANGDRVLNYFNYKGKKHSLFTLDSVSSYYCKDTLFLTAARENIKPAAVLSINNKCGVCEYTVLVVINNNKVTLYKVVSIAATVCVSNYNDTNKQAIINQLKDKVCVPLDIFETMTSVRATTVHTGKMLGMTSFSTCSLCNSMCVARSKVKNSICSFCYANDMHGMYPDLKEKCTVNFEKLTYMQLDILPILDDKKMPYVRFEAFGDLFNINQFINYVNIARVNPKIQFALWTKNPFIIKQAAMSGIFAPANMNIMYSSYFLNKVTNFDLKYCNGIFTVYTSDFLENNKNIVCNCGSKKCKECLLCYKRHDNLLVINEHLK